MGSACTKPNENNGNQANKKKNSSGMPDGGYNKTKSYNMHINMRPLRATIIRFLWEAQKQESSDSHKNNIPMAATIAGGV